MKKITVISLFVLLALVGTIGMASASMSKTVFRALIGGGATGSDAQGNAVFVYSDDGSQMMYKLVVNGLENTTQAHIHVASTPGGNGPVVLWLYVDQPPFVATLIPGVFNGLLGSRSVTSADLTGAAGILSLEDLRIAIEEGRAYVNVHTTLFPGGEIRGDIH